MPAALARKARQVLSDPVLRRWLIGRALNRWPKEPAFIPHRPPYAVGHLPLAAETPTRVSDFDSLPPGRIETAMTLDLAGTDVSLSPSHGADLMIRTFNDTEVLLALHRFAWLPVAGLNVDPAWVGALWLAWHDAHGTLDDSWAWHPYTAAERAINLIDFSRRAGVPEPVDDTITCLAGHAHAIAERLEYFGDHHTSNHLANNGRGLYRLGLDLGMDSAHALGRDILLAEAGRIFRPSGVLREGSSHYHLLVTRGYLDAWLCAERHGAPEAPDLRRIAARGVAVSKVLTATGGLPLIGDVSPDCPPSFLFGGWSAVLPAADRARLNTLLDETAPANSATLRDDGWAVLRAGPWDLTAFADPDGWPHMPGHGHQDTGSFDLRLKGEPVVVDPGRGRYGDDADAAFDRSAAAHSGVMIDAADPYPANKPYYDVSFRHLIGGPPPSMTMSEDCLELTFSGYGRLGSIGPVTRTWSVDTDGVLHIADSISGRGRRRVTRRLVLANEPARDGDAWRSGPARLHLDGEARVEPVTIWSAYGRGRPGWALINEAAAALPFSGTIRIEAV